MDLDIFSRDSTEESQGAEDMFKPFTAESYRMLVERDARLRELEIKREKHAQEAHLVDGELRFGAMDDEGRLPPENPDLKEGSLFIKDEAKFPSKLLGRPIEELDPGIRQKTFVIISSRFRKRYIHRFSATRSLLIFSPWNPMRKTALYIATHQLFDMFIFTTIVINCAFLTMPTWPLAEKIEYGFLAIYTMECIIKVVARGFIIHKHTYIREPWNILDFVVILSAFFTISVQYIHPDMTVGNTRGLRTFRVLRALKTVSILPGLKTIVNALLRAFKMLFEVILLTIFCLMVFAMFGLQMYDGVFRQKCVLYVTGYVKNPSETYDDYYIRWVRSPEHWYSESDNYIICGNETGAGACPDGYICLPDLGDNPRYGFLNFDHFGWALLTCFQLITLDFWEDIYNKIIRSKGPWHVAYFIFTIFVGSFYLINLMLAVVSMSYEEEAVSAVKEKEREKKEAARKKHNAMYDVSLLQMKAKLQATAQAVIGSETHSVAAANASTKDVNTNTKDVNTSAKNMNTSASDIMSSTDNETRMLLLDVPDNELLSTTKFKRVSTVSKQDLGLSQVFIEGEQGDQKPTVTIIKADALLDPEIGFMENQVIDRNCDCCEKWVCKYLIILKIQNYFYAFVSDPLFDLMITTCITINTLFMSLEHHNQSHLLTATLRVANYIFTAIFALEAIFKIIGLGKYYFIVGWNLFDFFTSLAGVLDLTLEKVDGLSVLRSFRLLRVFKLAQSWPTMRLLLTIILSTLGALGNLCLILCIVIYIFAVIGLQLFRDNYVALGVGGQLPRWNFTDFYHSMLMIFRVLCGEWIEPLYQCMRATNEICMVIFLPALVFGNFIVLNLFLALLLNAFASDSLDKHRESASERTKLMDGLQRLKQLLCCCCPGLYENSESVEDGTVCSSSFSHSADKLTDGQSESKDKNHSENIEKDEGESDDRGSKLKKSIETLSKEVDEAENRNFSNLRSRSNHKTDRGKIQEQSPKYALKNLNNSSYRQKTYSDIKRDSEKSQDEGTSTDDSLYGVSGPLPDCLPEFISHRMPCLDVTDRTKFGQMWLNLRTKMKNIVDSKTFESTVLLLIISSSLALAFEDIYLYQKPTLAYILSVSNIVFAFIFTCEMLCRWVGNGLTQYFTNLWTILDFFIVLVSLTTLIGDAIGFENIAGFKSLRTLRAFRPLRAISRWQGMKIVVNALMNAIPAIMNVFLVCMVFWLIFSIMGVQFFKGRFYRCVNASTLEVFLSSVVPNRNVCEETGGSWQNPNVNFDNAANGFLALFQVATFEGWMEVMASAVDATAVDLQPKYEASLYSYLYFVVFIVFGAFFSLNLFIGVIIDNFNVLKKKYEGSYLDAFLTQNQRNYYNTLKKLTKKKPQKIIKRPTNRFQLFFYNLATSSRFEMGIVLLIFLNMIVMAVYHYMEPTSVTDVLDMLNIVFIFIFTSEAAVKIIGLRFYYFRQVWNLFDFFVVFSSLLVLLKPLFAEFFVGILLNRFVSNLFVNPTLLRIVRVFRIGSILRLIKAAKGIRKLLFALIISLPAIFNIGALLFLVMFVYSILGMSSFGAVKINGSFDEIVNFQTFGNSFMLLLRLATSAGWNDILESLLIKAPQCDPHWYTLPDGRLKSSAHGDCGIPYLAIPFMVSYIIIVWLIVINMYIAVILENFNQAHEQEELGITEDDFDMFYTVWEKYDPYATQFIKFEQLVDFVSDLEPPLQIPKPNEITLVSFNLPIMEGEKMHCLDILIALVRNILSEVQESDELRTLKLQMEEKFAQSFPARVNIVVTSSTLQRKKEDVAARTLQRSWRSFKAQRAMRNITALAVQQKIQRTTNVRMRSRTNVMNNLSNRLSIALDRYFSLQKETNSSEEAVAYEAQKQPKETVVKFILPESASSKADEED